MAKSLLPGRTEWILKPCSQSSSNGSQIKPISFSLLRRSCDKALACLRCVPTQLPRLKPFALNRNGTRQCPSLCLKPFSRPNHSSQLTPIVSIISAKILERSAASSMDGPISSIFSASTFGLKTSPRPLASFSSLMI
jgi:hypothetical protein